MKWNCFFHRLGEAASRFQDEVVVEAGGVGTKLRPKTSTSVSMRDSWWEERFLMVLFLKLVFSSWSI